MLVYRFFEHLLAICLALGRKCRARKRPFPGLLGVEDDFSWVRSWWKGAWVCVGMLNKDIYPFIRYAEFFYSHYKYIEM